MRLTRRNFTGLAATAAGLAAIPTGSWAQDKIVLRYGNAGNAQTLSNRFNQKLADTISEKTGGSLSMEIFAGTLGGEQQLIESMALGSLDMYNGAYTGTREFDILYSPYFFRDGAHAGAVMKSEIGQKASAALQARYNARLLGVGRLGTYALLLREPASSFGDMAGRKIRTPAIEGCVEAVKSFGGSPTPVPFTEIYLALQQGIVDGVVTALNPAVAGKFYEVCKYVIANDFGVALDKEVISEAAWSRLSAEQQEVLQSTFDELEEADYHQVGIAQKSVDLDTWRSANGADSVIELDGSGLTAEMEPLNKRLAEEVYGAGAWDMIKGS